MKMAIYCIICDDQNEVDGFHGTKAIADKEARDLRKMGFEVKIKKFASWEAAEAFDEKLRSR